MSRLHVAWLKGWTAELDQAQKVLPELDCCPADLYRELAVRSIGASAGRLAWITDGDGPVAIILLRRVNRLAWEPALQWLVPGSSFPVRRGMTGQALAALGVPVNMGWWRMSSPLPPATPLRNIVSVPTYRLDLTGDYEAHWRSTHILSKVRRMRRRFEALACDVDRPGAAEWVIANWSMRWNGTDRAEAAIRDRILVAQALEARGEHHTIGLYDGDRMVAGSTVFVQGKDIVAGVYYTLPHYHQRGIDARLIDQSFSFAAGLGYSRFDIGGGLAYKAKWAPEEGSRETFTVAPQLFWHARRTGSAMRNLLRPNWIGLRLSRQQQ